MLDGVSCMSSVGNDSKSFRDMSAVDLRALLRVSMKDLLGNKVTPRATGNVKIRRQIARILTRLKKF